MICTSLEIQLKIIMRKFLYIFIFFSCLANSASIVANDICDATLEKPCVVQDTTHKNLKIKHWRTARMMYKKYKGNTLGLKHLWISASGAPSRKHFKDIAEIIFQLTDGKYKKMIDLDLREENHVYVNGQAFTLANAYDWINLGKTHEQSIVAEKKWMQDLTTQSYIFNVLTPKKFKTKQYAQGVNITINTLESEQQVAEDAGFDYVRLTITDHMAPRDEEVDRFVSFARTIQPDEWIYLHCRGGDGRSTSFFAMFDMLKNADKVSFNDIIKRQASVSPYYDLSQVERKDPYLTKYYKIRLKFLKQFYQFARASLQGYSGNWSAWIKEN